MTDIDILKDAVKVLGNIRVPVELFDSIGAPVYQVRQNLVALLQLVETSAVKPEEKTEEPEEDHLEIGLTE